MMTKSITFKESYIKGVFLRKSAIHFDERGLTNEWFDSISAPVNFNKIKINQLITAKSKKNVIRGVHFSGIKNPQFKIVRCIDGIILDFVVDLRTDSNTFGKYDHFILDSNKAETLFIPSGFGHGYQVLSKNAVVVYALQTNFHFEDEYVINPFDIKLDLPWQKGKYALSKRDSGGKNFDEYFH
jgi:dTDP-4-dehydrorhamnose 3,5-epimerase